MSALASPPLSAAPARGWTRPPFALAATIVAIAMGALAVAAYGWQHANVIPALRGVIAALLGATLMLVVLLAVVWRRALATQAHMLGHLDQLVREDGLTGITNRRGLDERLPQEMARAARSGTSLSIAMLDLDHFKRFNDRRGHGAGDALLRSAAQAWRKQLRPTDLLARYGGEEFTLVLPACDAEQAAALIERLRPLIPDRQTVSAGVAIWNGGDTVAELLNAADTALLLAKRGGRNRTVIADRDPQMALPLRVA